jgi:hypothetical protein
MFSTVWEQTCLAGLIIRKLARMNQNYYLVMAVYMKINPLRSKKKSRF